MQEKVATAIRKIAKTMLEHMPGVTLSMVAAKDADRELAEVARNNSFIGKSKYADNLDHLADSIGYYRETDKLPEFDPIYRRYMGQAYQIPEDMDKLQKIHTQLMGKPWKASTPRWLEWLMKPQHDRLLHDLAKNIAEHKANIKGLKAGEIASLLYPNYILRDDGKIAKIKDYDLSGHPMQRLEDEKGNPLYKPVTKEAIKRAVAWAKKNRKQIAVNDNYGGPAIY